MQWDVMGFNLLLPSHCSYMQIGQDNSSLTLESTVLGKLYHAGGECVEQKLKVIVFVCALTVDDGS